MLLFFLAANEQWMWEHCLVSYWSVPLLIDRPEEDSGGAAGQHHAEAGQAGVQGGEHLQRHGGQPHQRHQHQHGHAQRHQRREGERGR